MYVRVNTSNSSTWLSTLIHCSYSSHVCMQTSFMAVSQQDVPVIVEVSVLMSVVGDDETREVTTQSSISVRGVHQLDGILVLNSTGVYRHLGGQLCC